MSKEEHADVLYNQIRPKDILATKVVDLEKKIKWLTIKGILKYGGQLMIVEVGQITSIFVMKLIIDHLNTDSKSLLYGIILFLVFTVGRLAAVVARNYYDLHVYNYFRFV